MSLQLLPHTSTPISYAAVVILGPAGVTVPRTPTGTKEEQRTSFIASLIFLSA
jgi:hypothetical protein